MKKSKHTLENAQILLHFLKIFISKDAKLIGSLSKGYKTSDHDIDILLPTTKKTNRLKNQLKNLLIPTNIENTDWGGLYFNNTLFGNVDIFFIHPENKII